MTPPIGTLVSKALMALTGLFLCVFLVVHLAGNLQLLLPQEEARQRFNGYAEFLAGLPPIQVAAWVTYASILGHGLLSVALALRNRRARRGAPSTAAATKATSTSRWMMPLGIVVFLFLLLHLADFWLPFKFGHEIGSDERGQRDLYGLVVRELQVAWRVALYVLAALALGLHLDHGVFSGLRSLGLSHPKVSRWARWGSRVFAWVVAAGFAALPLFLMFFR